MKKILLLLVIIHLLPTYGQAFETGRTELIFTDDTRFNSEGKAYKRKIPCEVFYPTEADKKTFAKGAFPVVIFSHGFVMGYDAYNNIWEHLVPRGYIVMMLKTEGSFSPSHIDMAKDIGICTSQIQDESTRKNSLFYAHVAPEVCIMGHSMGGGASVLALYDSIPVTTYIGLAAAVTNPPCTETNPKITQPCLILAGGADAITPPYQHAQAIFESLQTPVKTYIQIAGANHCQFANPNVACDFGETTMGNNTTLSRTEQQTICMKYVDLWLDHYLQHKPGAIDEFYRLLKTDSGITTLSFH